MSRIQLQEPVQRVQLHYKDLEVGQVFKYPSNCYVFMKLQHNLTLNIGLAAVTGVTPESQDYPVTPYKAVLAIEEE